MTPRLAVPPRRRFRLAVLGGALLLAGLAGAGAWWEFASPPEEDPSELPVPPVPPRIAEGSDYDHCLSMLASDPEGANDFADAWEATGGGDGAIHCHALAQVALGNAQTGAEMMEKLAQTSHAPDVARASMFSQAGQAWEMAGDPNRAYGAATMALALDPENPDLLIDRAFDAGTLEHFQESVEDLDRALAIDPHRADALVYRASALRQLGKLDKAQDDIARALTEDPESADALLERGILRQRRGDLTGARADWERAIELAPDTPTSDLAQQDIALLDAGPAQ